VASPDVRAIISEIFGLHNRPKQDIKGTRPATPKEQQIKPGTSSNDKHLFARL